MSINRAFSDIIEKTEHFSGKKIRLEHFNGEIKA